MPVAPSSTSFASPAPPSRRRSGYWLALAAALVAVKLAWLAGDATPMLFIGDSESYLATALDGWIPPDRSFLYGFMLRPLAIGTGSLAPLVLAQSACGVVAALVLAHLLVSAFAAPRAVAFAAAVAWAGIEPLALLYERYVMTEAFALVAFAAYVGLALRYIASRRVRDVVLAQAAGTMVIAFRTVFVPVSLAFALALPLLAWAGRMPKDRRRAAWRGLAIGLAASIGATLALHQAYKVVNGQLGGRVAYSQADGLFLLAAWAPVLVAQDFPDRALGEAVIAQSACVLSDRSNREAQRWYPGCIVDVLERRVGSAREANAVARSAARHALRRDPLGVAQLAMATWLDGLDADKVDAALRWDRGVHAYRPTTVALLRDRMRVAHAETLHALETPTKRWHAASTHWVMLLQLAPALAFLALVATPRDARRAMLFVALLAAGIVGANALGSTGTVPRYLHALGWLTVIPLAVLGAWTGRALLRVVRRVAPRAEATLG